MAILDELLVELGFEYDPEDIEQFNKDLDDTISSVKALAKALVAGTAAIVGFSVATSAASDRQGKLAKQTGISVGNIDAYEFALRRAGGQAEAMATNLENLAIRVSEAARGTGSGIEAFGILGVSITDVNGDLKDTDRILLEVSDAMQGLSKSQQIEIADKLGLRESILLLQEGSDGIRKLVSEAKALGVTTEEDARLAEEFQDSLADIWQIMKQISRTLARQLLPILEDFSNLMTTWWIDNRKVIEQKLPEYIDKLTLALKILTVVAGLFIAAKFGKFLLSLITLFKTLTIQAIAAKLAIAAIPVLITSILAGIALLAEDAKVFFEGGDSFIGRMIEKYPEWADELRTIAAIFATINDLTGMVFTGWGEIFDLFSSGTFIEDFKIAFNQAVIDISDLFKEIFINLKNFVIGIWDDIVLAFSDKVITPIMDKLNSLKELFTFDLPELPSFDLPELPDFVPSFLTRSPEDIRSPNLSPIRNDIENTRNNTSNQTKISLGGINVNVGDSTGNPNETGKQIGESIRRELSPILEQASKDMNSAVVI